MKKTRIRVVLIAVIILMCLCCDGLLIVSGVGVDKWDRHMADNLERVKRKSGRGI